MPSIKVMSWNIQKMGAAKIDAEVTSSEDDGKRAFTPAPDQTYILDYIVKVIQLNDVDIIGIMEIMGSEGDWIKEQLINKLLPEVWNGAVSSKQVGNPREEYLYLWKESTSIISLNTKEPVGPSPVSLINTIDDNSMTPIFEKLGSTCTPMQLYDALEWNGYIKNFNFASDQKLVYRVNFEKWNDLANKNATVVLNKDDKGKPLNLGLTPQQLDIIKNILVQTDIILFPVNGQRSPFLLNLNLKDGINIFKMLFALFHAPGPPSGNKLATLRKSSLFTGINNIGLSAAMQNAQHLLLMGDFNVTAENRATAIKSGIVHNYTRRTNPQGRFVFAAQGPLVKQDVFASITGSPINADCLIADNVKTSITSNINESTTQNSVGASPYDKFFFKSKNDSIRQSSPMCVDLISQMNPERKSDGIYKQELAKLGTFFFKCRRSNKVFKTKIKRLVKNNNNAKARLQKKYVKKTSLENTGNATNPLSPQYKRQKANLADINASTTAINNNNQMIDDMMEIDELISPNYIVVPPNFNCAVEIFAAISDHLPISVSLNF